MALIEQGTGLKMPIRTAGEPLKRWGVKPQTSKNAYEQSPKAVQKWLGEEHPESRAKADNVEIY